MEFNHITHEKSLEAPDVPCGVIVLGPLLVQSQMRNLLSCPHFCFWSISLKLLGGLQPNLTGEPLGAPDVPFGVTGLWLTSGADT